MRTPYTAAAVVLAVDALLDVTPGADIMRGATLGPDLAEIGLDYNLRDALGVFIENKDVFGLTVIARLNNILEENAALERTLFTGPRGSGAPILFHENRQREVGHIVNFTVRGSF